MRELGRSRPFNNSQIETGIVEPLAVLIDVQTWNRLTYLADDHP